MLDRGIARVNGRPSFAHTVNGRAHPAIPDQVVRAVIADPRVAELLIPRDHPIGTKRICTDTNYYQTYNRDNV
ncbi:hypothetical protein, partial [Nocardia neocaledoniensis]|uniref:hypothetical protein n=1 Tax=Nocardia neocaledoniensis TaxID=236511 RepID=UPI00245641B1